MSSDEPSLAERLGDVQVGARSDLSVTRHIFRGEVAYIVTDQISFTSHRLTARDYEIFVHIDADRTLGETFRILQENGVLEPEQDESFYRYVMSMHNLGFLSLPISNDKALYKRYEQKRERRRKEIIRGFLFLRIPLVDPDAFLERTIGATRFLFSRAAFITWVIVMALCAVVVSQRFNELKEPLSGLLATQNLLWMWVLLIGLKVVHELGHGYACKHYGGAVPEMGAYMILFTPCAYVDASASWGFTKKWHRIVVGLGGMYFESYLAALALFVWCMTDASLVNSLAYQTMILASITTVGFNINPLMRYDGYFILSDILEIPNLRRRASGVFSGLAARIFVGVRRASPSRMTASVRATLLGYGLSAFLYRIGLLAGIGMLLIMKFHWIGLLAAVVYLGSSVLGMMVRLVRWLWASEETEPMRARAITLSLLILVGVPGVVLLAPAPARVVATGVAGHEYETVVHAPVPGRLTAIEVAPLAPIPAGDVIAVLDDPEPASRAAEARAQLDAARIRERSAMMQGPSALQEAGEQADHLAAVVARSEEAIRGLTVRNGQGGVVTTCLGPRDLGRFLFPGDEIATIGRGSLVVRVLLTAEEIVETDLVVGARVQCRSAQDAGIVVSGIVRSVARSGSRRIAHEPLAHTSGGEISVDPSDGEAAQPYFEVVVDLEGRPAQDFPAGSRAWVLFDAEDVTIGRRLYRRVLRLTNDLGAGA